MSGVVRAIQTSASLSLLTVGVVLFAQWWGAIPDRDQALRASRASMCESLAIHTSIALRRGRPAEAVQVAKAIIERTAEVASAGVRAADGNLLLEIGSHRETWVAPVDNQSTLDAVIVPVTSHEGRWGAVEVRFKPRSIGFPGNVLREIRESSSVFVGLASLVTFAIFVYLTRQRHESAIPDRVRSALNTLVQGVLIVNKDEKIALANDAFAKSVGTTAEQLKGRRAADFDWETGGENASDRLPWQRALHEGAAEAGAMVCLHENSSTRTFLVNSAPIVADDGTLKGAIASFDDVTALKRQELNLRRALAKLRESRARMRRQNQLLQQLAGRDPLTNCLNRRAFLEAFESHCAAAIQYQRPLACVMLDVDHFKSVNDRFGHRVGDQVLERVAGAVRANLNGGGLICRYGGEEFCVLLPGGDTDAARQAAEQFRAAVASEEIGETRVTASFGVAALHQNVQFPADILEQADQALYAAKRTGRNRVVVWEPALARLKETEQEPRRIDGAASVIPFHAVTSLLSALNYRHSDTAEHSRRVADLAVATAVGIMSHRDCYCLEVAALLHDIGKIGVPDSVLLKPGPLTEDEWSVMRTHDQIGEEIISAVFNCPQLTETVRACHAWYAGAPHDRSLPIGGHIPLAARILTIADAYDAMVSNRVYRVATDHEGAITELRRCSGTQFDPDLVERFIDALQARDENRASLVLSVSKNSALRIGLEMERLADALDQSNVAELARMARSLKQTATDFDIAEIARVAEELEQASVEQHELSEIVRLTLELLELCRATQRSYFSRCGDPSVDAESAMDMAIAECG